MKIIYRIAPLLRLQTNIEELVPKPIVLRVNQFEAADLDMLVNGISEAHNTGQQVIPVIIDSCGGDVRCLMGMVAEIESSRLPVATIIESTAMSAGACLAAMGTIGYRYMAPHATMMMHNSSLDASISGEESIENMKTTVRELERLNKELFKMVSAHCGHEPDYFNKLFRAKQNADWYIKPRGAKKHGLTDHIGLPEMLIEVKITHKFGINKPPRQRRGYFFMLPLTSMNIL